MLLEQEIDERGYLAGIRVTKRKKVTVLLTLTLSKTPTLTLILTPNLTLYSKFVFKPILKEKIVTKCHSVNLSRPQSVLFTCYTGY
jgi:hypothetical protein